ncbi:hypothetical protein SAMN05444000_103125 [Shimia gijangensis]|uniref:Uncharacterized protein n=1 Tax=Shimia gijangensis TaxID=1470563 RepID=A0A1M6E6X4_9RHOB|nr:hypothetical protein SAMN05444000_103125 [Shimia gijangensis]
MFADQVLAYLEQMPKPEKLHRYNDKVGIVP